MPVTLSTTLYAHIFMVKRFRCEQRIDTELSKSMFFWFSESRMAFGPPPRLFFVQHDGPMMVLFANLESCALAYIEIALKRQQVILPK
jgi:hypothetical protein